MVLLYILSIFVVFFLTETKKLSVTSVSTLQSKPNSTVLYGSQMGGTVLYIKGTGFHQNPSLNEVLVGDYPCIVPDEGIKEETLLCTTSPILPKQNASNLAIVVISNKEKVTTSQRFTYSREYTPCLVEVYPQHSFANKKIRFIGTHRISDLGNSTSSGKVKGLFIGENICNRNGINQKPIDSNLNDSIQCIQAPISQAGKYTVKEQVTYGYTSKSSNLLKTSLNGSKYEYVVLPTVESFSPNNGSIAGEQLTIKGTGFPASNKDKKNLQVTLDNTECQIVQTSTNQIRCNLKKKSLNSLRIQNSLNNSQFTYVSGSGFKYSFYQYSSQLSSFISEETNSPSTLKVYELGVKGQLYSLSFDSKSTVQTYEGYFYAPNPGKYAFIGQSNQEFMLFLNPNPGVPSIDKANHLLIKAQNNSDNSNPYSYLNTNQYKEIDLQGGKYYFMKAYFRRNDTGDSFKVYAQVPNTNMELGWKAPQIQSFKLNFTNQPLIYRLRSLGATSGFINISLFIVNPDTLAVVVNVTKLLPFDASPEMLCVGILEIQSSFFIYNNDPKCTISYLDENLDILPSNTPKNEIFGYEWLVQYSKPLIDPLRQSKVVLPLDKFQVNYIQASSFNSEDPYFTQQKIQDQGPLINGTFNIISGTSYLNYTSYSVDFPFNVNATTLENSLRKFYNNDKIIVTEQDPEKAWNGQLGKTWTIRYDYADKEFPTLQFATDNLTGGQLGTYPKIYFQNVKKYGQRLLYDPVSFQLMKTFSSKPSIVVTVNNIPSVCPFSSCQFKYLDETPKVSQLSKTSTDIVMNLTSESLKSTSKVQVKIENENICQNIVFQTNTSIVCNYFKNQDGFPVVPAGKYHPSVYLEGIGYLEYEVSVPEMQIQFSLSNPSPINGSVLGSYPITLRGKGLPKDSSQLSIKVCDIHAQIISSNPSSVTFVAPQIKLQFTEPILNCSIKIQYSSYAPGQLFDGGYFIYQKQLSPPTIFNLSKSQSNPTKKGVLQIFGSGFDANGEMNKSNINVFLKGLDNDRRYQLRVLQVSDIRIKVGLSGGLTGYYEVQVEIKGKGFAKVSTDESVRFYYANTIQSILPSEGSYFGGREIHINGKSFSSDVNQNQVHIGGQNCAMVQASQNSLKCLTPPKDESNIDQSVQVIVTSRQISKSVCNGTCSFTYMSLAESPMIFSLTQSIANQSDLEITIQGSNLFKQNSLTQVIAIHRISKQKITFTPLNFNDTHIVWKTKPMRAGQYFLFVNVQNVGYSNITIFRVTTLISSVTGALSTQGGIISIKGFGFPQKLDQEPFEMLMFQSVYQTLLQPKIISNTPEQIKIQVSQRKANEKLEIQIVKSFSDRFGFEIEFTDLKTPKAKMVSNKQVQWKNNNPIILSITSGSMYVPETVRLCSILQPMQEIEVTWSHNSTHITIQNNLQPGTYRFKILNTQSGYYQVNDTLTITLPNISQTFQFVSSSLSVQGGHILVKYMPNSLPQTFGKHSSFLVNGIKTQIETLNQTHFRLSYPSFVRSNKKYAQEIALTNLQPEEKKKLQDLDEQKEQKEENIDLENYFKWTDSQNNDLTNSVFDSLTKTGYFSSNSQCQIGIYFGQDNEVEISKIKFYPNKSWDKPGSYLKGGKFQGSPDNITWNDIKTLDTKIERGWNTITFKKQDRSSLRYFRFIHNSNSGCSLGELQIKGNKISKKNFSSIANPTTPLTQRSVILSYSDGVTNYQWKDILFTYSDQQTPVIASVQPPRGNVEGGQIIELIGTGLNSGIPEIFIDDKICQIINFNSTSIKCITSPRLQTPKRISFEVFVNGKTALIKQNFRYVYRWSDQDTWGVDLPPIEGDLIYIPPNMHLYIDQSTPKLAGIIAQNSTIEISDQLDIEVHTANIILTGAQLIAGTPLKPHQHKLTFNFYGVEGENQIPFFGNKGIGCSNCKVSLHGKEKQAWSRVSSISQGENQITSTYPQPLNWQNGDEIVVSSSSFDYLQSQKLTIANIDKASSLLNIQTKQYFKYDHQSSFEKTKTDEVFIGAEIASLTRNIKLQGDENSDSSQYGIHLTFIGNEDSGLQVKISNVELKNCGQPKKSRHCINFNRNSDMLKSYIKNSTASQTYGKFISVSSTNFLTLSSNVGYRVKGHNIELKDGTEQNNIIEGNLMISSLPFYRDLQTDVMVASYYISNPNNIIKDNIAAGSYYYGFLYDLKTKSQDGIYAQDSICTSGYSIGVNKGNVAHSVRKIGVRIKDLITRLNPCQPLRNDYLLDPWSVNPSKESLFQSYVIYRIGQLGLMCDSIGHVKFKNFTMAQNNRSHMEFHIMNFTKENVVVTDSTFIGLLDPVNSPISLNTKALVLPRSGSINVTNVLFNKYVQNQTIIQTCSLCDRVQFFTNNGQEYFFEKVQYQNINKATYLEMLGLEREIIYDNDGTFTTGVFDNIARTKATVIKGFQHILSQPGCYLPSNQSLWDGSAVCGSNLTVRKITFMNVLPVNYTNFYPPFVARIPNNVNEPLKQGLLSTTIQYTGPQTEIINSWSAPFITGSKYQIRTDFGLDHIAIQASKLLKPQDKAIIFKLAYTLTTQLFDVYKMRNLQLGNLITSLKINNLNSSSCQNGDSYHNNSLLDFQVCISGKNTTLYELIDITPVYCRYECPLPPEPVIPTVPDVVPGPVAPPVVPVVPVIDPNLCIRQDFVRKWSNSSQWPSNRLPYAGQNVTVHCNWTVQLDIDPAPAAQIIIDGTLIVPQDRQLVNVTAQSIWVRKGSWFVGNQTDSFDKKMIIQLNGNQDDRGFAVDPNYAGRKNLIVTGRLEIYGPTDFDEATYLTKSAEAGSTLIHVNSANGWKVGDQIVLSTSSRSWNQSQKVTIKNIIDLEVQISSPLAFFHYGSVTPQVDYQNSQLFTATKVIYVSRNIKIVSGPLESYGFSIFVYGYIDNNQRTHMGSVYMRGVEMSNGGQGGSGPAVLGFKNTVASSKTSQISKCSFNKCGSECVKFENAKNLIFENNVLYDAIRSHIKGVQLRQVRISSNIMINSRKDIKSSQNVSVCLENKQMINTPYEDNLTIFSNECYGSEDIGFILPYLPCSKNTWEISNNIAGGCLTGFFMVKLQKQTSKCVLCQNFMAFNCKYGILGNPDDTTNLTYNKLILIGNQQGLILRFTTKEKNNTAYLTNSFVSPVLNKDCPECNIIGGDCSNSVGVRVLSVTQTGPGSKFAFNSTEIRSSSPLDAKTFVLNTQFSHFKSNYSEIQNLKNCQNNFIFKAHEQAIDLIGSTYLHESRAVQSDNTSLVYFRFFDTKYLGLQGGCGESNCTSLQNYFIQDFSGEILGSIGSKALPNNMYFSNKTLGCEFKETMNGYLCNQTEQVSVMEFESIARDFNTRIIWPINLISYSNDAINNTLNVQKQWSYRNGYPEGKRKARVSSLIKLNTTYNLTFYNRAPADMIFQIQQKRPTVEDFAWIKLVLQYPDENSIRIKANDKDMNPIILLDNQTQSAPSLQVCGSYKYVYNRKYIEFILTTDCKVRMSFVSSVKASIRLDQAVGDFFTNNGTGKFIDKMCVILGITDTSRLKIVGVYTGSTIIDFYVEQQQKTIESNSTLAPSSSESASSLEQLSQQLDQAVSSGHLQTVLTSAGLGNVLSVTSTVVLVNETGQFQIDQSQLNNPIFDDNNPNSQKQESNNSTIIIIICVVSVVVIALLSAAIVYLKFYRKPSTVENSSIMEEEIKQEVVSEIEKELSLEKSSQIHLSYFEQRKKFNMENVKKNSKIKKSKFSTIDNSSVISFKNPFDDHYMPQKSHQKIIQDQIEIIDPQKSYKH